MALLLTTGRHALSAAARVRAMTILVVDGLVVLVRGKADRRALIERIHRYGVRAVPAAVFSGLAVGFLALALPLSLLAQVGGDQTAAGLLAVPVLRDIGPLVAAFLVAGHAGPGVPRKATLPERVANILPASSLSAALLYALSMTVALGAGLGLGALWTGRPLLAELEWVGDSVRLLDLAHGLGKVALFGLVVGAIRSYHSLVLGAPGGVLRSVVVVLSLNLLFSWPFYRGLL